ncbi:MAG: caspase family protein [Proteobacteria bacterium]|nr:caspase family protein [Pseudomonadota bacterium]
MKASITLALALALTLATGSAHADGDPIATYALVLGSNSGGQGQVDLHFAEDDARRVAQVLTELGGYAPRTVDVLPHPTPQLVRERLAALSTTISAEVAAGKQVQLFFYYSGHARATALDLGNDQLPLAELRQRLFAIPATLTVVVLDACQSGAFSRVKGATPAADFSFSSKQHLDASGIAVLASSSGSELSQESEQLRSSYFTHHLLVGLRGAGDANHDGQVSIDEAYRYAYHQTLIATAETAVGGQHVSLEVDLKGHGEVPLSYPRKATAAIELPPALEGQTLVEDRRSHTVVAETYKAKGTAVRIAVAPGDYTLVVRQGDRLSRCDVAASATSVVDLARCSTEAVVVATRKGGGFEHPLRVELALAAGGERDDDYTRTLTNFGYSNAQEATTGVTLTGLRRIHPYVWIGATGAFAGAAAWRREGENHPQSFEWATSELFAVAHGELPLGSEGFASRLAGYVRVGLGLGVASTRFVDAMGTATDERFLGAAALVAAGFHTGYAETGGFGMSFGYQGEYAPIISNNLDQTHASGGHRLVVGVSYGF